jgi:hypothetical protein
LASSTRADLRASLILHVPFGKILIRGKVAVPISITAIPLRHNADSDCQRFGSAQMPRPSSVKACDFTMRDHLSSEREENNLALSICTLLRFPGDPRYEQAT